MAVSAEPNQIANLARKVALITGGSNGLGRAIAEHYAAAGAFVVSADLSPSTINAPLLTARRKHIDLETPTVDLLNARYSASSGPRAIFVKCDVTNPSDMRSAVAAAVEQYGRLDIMVNNAGIASESKAWGTRTHEQPEVYIEKDLAINVKGVWMGCKYAITQMLAQPPHPSGDKGWIINMASIGSLIGYPGISPYCASKGAVLAMTRAIALEYASEKIHINCISPGFADTTMLEIMPASHHEMANKASPWGRLALPEDIAQMAVFLAGPGASYCTGSAYVVDGGYTAQ